MSIAVSIPCLRHVSRCARTFGSTFHPRCRVITRGIVGTPVFKQGSTVRRFPFRLPPRPVQSHVRRAFTLPFACPIWQEKDNRNRAITQQKKVADRSDCCKSFVNKDLQQRAQNRAQSGARRGRPATGGFNGRARGLGRELEVRRLRPGCSVAGNRAQSCLHWLSLSADNLSAERAESHMLKSVDVDEQFVWRQSACGATTGTDHTDFCLNVPFGNRTQTG
jgi:hypothetical protein